MPTLVNKWSRFQSGGSSTSNTVGVAPGTGNNLIIAVNVNAGGTVSVSDNVGNSYQTALTNSTGSGAAYLSLFYLENITSIPTGITASTPASPSNIFVAEVSGLARSGSLDAVSTIKGAHSASASSNSVTPTQLSDYAFAFVGDGGTKLTYSAWGGGFAQEDFLGPNNVSSAWADQVLSSTSAISASVTLSAIDNWSMVLALFKAPSIPAAVNQNLALFHPQTVFLVDG